MIDLFKKLFEVGGEQLAPPGPEQQRLAAAALMVEVAAIDEHFAESERTTLLGILRSKFSLDDAAVSALQQQAQDAQANASSLHDHTRIINEQFSAEQKSELIANLWQVAYADGELDKYEEHIIRRISDLLYVPHGEFIRAKLWARDQSA